MLAGLGVNQAFGVAGAPQFPRETSNWVGSPAPKPVNVIFWLELASLMESALADTEAARNSPSKPSARLLRMDPLS